MGKWGDVQQWTFTEAWEDEMGKGGGVVIPQTHTSAHNSYKKLKHKAETRNVKEVGRKSKRKRKEESWGNVRGKPEKKSEPLTV